MTNQASFAEYGTEFQEKIIQALLVDKTWAEQMVEVIRPEFFDLNYLKYIAARYFEHYSQFKAFPTAGILITSIKQALKTNPDRVIMKDIRKFFLKIRNSPDMCDLPYVKQESLAFCKKQKMAEALEKGVDLIEADRYEEVVSVMKSALVAGQEASLGHDFEEDREERWTKDFRCPVPTGIPQLDDKYVLAGGVGKGELAVLAASKGVGKSHWLVHIGAVAVERGLNVVHYSFELGKLLVGLRYDSWFCDINSNEIVDRVDEVRAKHNELLNSKEKKRGKLVIKKYPIRTVTCNAIRAHLQRLQLKKDFKPDLIIVDYADNLTTAEKYDASQTRFELKRIYEELRNIAEEYDAPLWSASQINREGSKDDLATIEHLAEAFGKADDPDIIITLSCNQKKKAGGFVWMFIAKSRAGNDGLRLPIKINRGTSKFKVASEDEMPKDIREEEEEAKKKARRAAQRMRSKNKKELDRIGTEKPQKTEEDDD